MGPRRRFSRPVDMDLSDSLVVDKFIEDSAVASKLMFDAYVQPLLDSTGAEVSISFDSFLVIENLKSEILDFSLRCDTFCPHISSLPCAIAHFILPAINVTTCVDCSLEWFASMDPDDKSCDACGRESVWFNEFNIQVGPGVLALNVGDCCIHRYRV